MAKRGQAKRTDPSDLAALFREIHAVNPSDRGLSQIGRAHV